ncbi:MAG TPA: hypothetical protein VM934_02885 [Pyrinomonadaceae bacterium]|jgi:hypothetical protein|nr:hypothetical protein [Pyrinomonadaceae bacterium]
MSEKEAKIKESNEGQGAATEASPAEKLEEQTPTGSLVPGAENPESLEIKKEFNPNSE